MTLTEQWKKGELEQGWYYVQLIRGEYRIDLYIKDKNEWIDCPDAIIDAVVCAVPSYEEWRQLRKWCEEFNALDVAKENQQLKELLKECREKFVEAENNYGFDDAIVDICDQIIEEIDNAIGEKK